MQGLERTYVKRVAVKYCGGCNPSYDRVELVRRIKDLAGERIQWIQGSIEGFDAVLLISGCHRACAESQSRRDKGWEVVSIGDGDLLPEEIVALLINEGVEKHSRERLLRNGQMQGPRNMPLRKQGS